MTDIEINRDWYNAIDIENLSITDQTGKLTSDLTSDFWDTFSYLKEIIEEFRDKSEKSDTHKYDNIIKSLVEEFNNQYLKIQDLWKYLWNTQSYTRQLNIVKSNLKKYRDSIEKWTDWNNALTNLNNLKNEYLEYIIQNNNLDEKVSHVDWLIEKVEWLAKKLSEKWSTIDKEWERKWFFVMNTEKMIKRYFIERAVALWLAIVLWIVILVYSYNLFRIRDISIEREIILNQAYSTWTTITYPIEFSDTEIKSILEQQEIVLNFSNIYNLIKQILFFSVLFYLLSLFISQYKISSNLFVSYSQKQSMLDVYPLIIDTVNDSDEKKKIEFITTEKLVNAFISENDSHMYSKNKTKDPWYKSLLETLINKLPLWSNNVW